MAISLFPVLGKAATDSPWDTEDSIREELFSIERLEEHADTLAAAQNVTMRPLSRPPLSARLKDNEAVLLDAYGVIANAVRKGEAASLAAEWFVDNYHIVEKQIREVRDDLPPGYYRQLPKLADGPFAGYPRVFGLAWAYVAHTDSRFDPDTLCRFVRAYQKVQPLTIGELWAVAITLRIVLVENLRRAVKSILSNRTAHQNADALADRLLGVNDQPAEPVAELYRRYEQDLLSEAFAVQLAQRLRDQDPKVTPAVVWLEERLAAQGITEDELAHNEHQHQGATGVTTQNIITSMRHISSADWPELFESISLVDERLRSSSGYAKMDFPTRNTYRSAIEKLARGSNRTELEITQLVLITAASSEFYTEKDDGWKGVQDPGYYLIAGGRSAFEKRIGFKARPLNWLTRFNTQTGICGYIGCIIATTAMVIFYPLCALGAAWGWSVTLVFLGVMGVIPAMNVAVSFVNRIVMLLFGAKILPSLKLSEGVTSDLRTIVVVPTLLTSQADIDEQIERIEIHYLANPEGEVHFAVLTDWCDALTEHVAGDDDLLNAATVHIANLNDRYGPMAAGERFHLFHRRRVWNEKQKQWIGWERKRGKLHEFNKLLRGATDTTFITLGGRSPAPPPSIKYVITLDSDTRLPRDAVRRLVGKMAHPLNQPRFDDAGCIAEGYVVLQPRVTPSLPIGREGSLFTRVFSSMCGIDPYASVVSDVYQDLFRQGSYIGKGIYDVDAFESALDGRVPENTLLSHDLFEGTFARAGLVSDIEVIEEYPARFDVAAARQHRWARGDWQLLPWILGYNGAGQKYMLPLLGRWKMVDNLRQTLTAPATVAAFVLGWTLPYGAAALWTFYILLTIAVPTLLPFLEALMSWRSRITIRSRIRSIRGDLWLSAAQTGLTVTFLAYQSWLMADAIGRTLYRLYVSHMFLLEWVTAAHTKLSPRPHLLGFYRQMAGGIVIGSAAVVVVWHTQGNTWWISAPFIALWLVSPAIALWTSLTPILDNHRPVSRSDRNALRLVARRTWRYFETFVTAADHMLPPDNFQEDPKATLAHRTSPTNLGLYLLSVVSARDFGWIGTTEAVERLESTLATMSSLQQFRGHFYNWYDTKDLRPLDPLYVSTVDSGNLAGHLIAVANSCREWGISSLTSSRLFAGIEDSLSLARETFHQLPDDRRTEPVTRHEVESALAALGTAIGYVPSSAQEVPLRLKNLSQQASIALDLTQTLASTYNSEAYDELLFWVQAIYKSIESHRRDLAEGSFDKLDLSHRLTQADKTTHSIANSMEFGFLLDPLSKLLSIGYIVAEGRRDASCYDLLASEACLASFIAIAKGDLRSRHWFLLGRSVTPIEHGAALVSWSGSMFEYLMPSLVMHAPVGSLIDQTNRLIVNRQISYGAELGFPWGISESAYNARDIELTYQYSNFGVPGLGLKRGLGANIVVAPYATALAAMIKPQEAAENFVQLEKSGARGRYGFYEAMDYTPSRLPEDKTHEVVRAYMAHHQGMTVVSIANVVLDSIIQDRFHAEPIVQATELLLQERTPRDVSASRPWAQDVGETHSSRVLKVPLIRRLRSPHGSKPTVHLLSNGRYAVMVTAAGSGYSRWRDLGITRWREDATCDDWGSYIYLRDVQSAEVWSAGYQPIGNKPDSYQARFSEDKAEFTRRDGTITTVMEIVVSPEADAEVRRISLSNKGILTREIDLTSYAELALTQPAADVAHPAFSKLFIHTEYDARTGVVLATRRLRSKDEPEVWAAQLSIVEGETIGKMQIETDRAIFLGRGHDVRSPIGIFGGHSLSNTVGNVLDPIFAIRRRVRIKPKRTVRVAFWTLIASSREELLNLVDKHLDANAFERACTMAWTQAQVQLRHLDIDAEEASIFQRLASHILCANSALRPSTETIIRGCGDPAAVWAQGISGDLPIVLVRIDDIVDIAVVAQLLRAHEYWRMKRLAVDLVILNEHSSSYIQDLNGAIEKLVRTSQSRHRSEGEEARGSVFVLRADLISQDTRARLPSVSRVVLAARQGNLSDQLDRLRTARDPITPSRRVRSVVTPQPALDTSAIEFFNGLGGFTENGQEYITTLKKSQTTPAPWMNVISNTSFGFQVSTEGSGYTWSMNSRENQLTPWSNDPVTDHQGEVIYIRDEDSGVLWCPTAQPIREEAGPYIVRHGKGYSRFEYASHDIKLDLLQYVPLNEPIKVSRLWIHNTSVRVRRLSVTSYVEWVLAQSRSASAPFIITEMDSETGALFARNPWNATFGSRIAFTDLCGRQTKWTGDRREFIGRNGSLGNPSALSSGALPLSKRVGAGLDPCGVLQAPLIIKPGETVEIAFFLGETATVAEAQSLIMRYRGADLDADFHAVVHYWGETLGTIQVKTPDRAMDIMLNSWFLYQTLACRLWARSGFYQASGAYGFRDQLQDGMSIIYAKPEITREHLLRAAGRQFVEGDVQHWWLPTFGQGVRTRISDDRIWLAYTVAHYIKTTGDLAILDEPVPFLEGQNLKPNEHDAYFQPTVSDEKASLFEHCARALDQSLGLGVHGLPLIGTGDWNDGMNRVGELGKGESVWLGWFLHAALTAFADLAHDRKEQKRTTVWHAHAQELQTSLERHGWDGDWYRRGFFDDGTMLGSSENEECRIDSIAQSWSVISGAAEPDRTQRAMASFEEWLVQRETKLALLFAPPFENTLLDPGYVKSYPPGIRENGGQYTHAAAWAVIAFAMLGEGDKASDLFSLINPINHASTRANMYRYKVEPYVAAADVYSKPPYVGRGGWTWYTGSAGWMYKAGIESILGLRRQGAFLLLAPCIPKNWPRFEIVFRHVSTRYEILVENPHGVNRGILTFELDGESLSNDDVRVPLVNDGKVHKVLVILG